MFVNSVAKRPRIEELGRRFLGVLRLNQVGLAVVFNGS